MAIDHFSTPSIIFVRFTNAARVASQVQLPQLLREAASCTDPEVLGNRWEIRNEKMGKMWTNM
jgi:hypothetical protein